MSSQNVLAAGDADIGNTAVATYICPLHANLVGPTQLASADGQMYQETQINTIVLAGLLELPFLLIAVVFAFRTANALKGGVFGRGMLLIALGALVMAIGHLHLQAQTMWGLNIFGSLLGSTVGTAVWIIALMITWALTGAGFYSIYKTSKAG
jgi:hypothetical protein